MESANVYINDVSSFLPNEPIGNDQIENVLGALARMPTRAKSLTLKSNRIRQRYYAIDPETKQFTHTNAQLVAEAVRRLKPTSDFVLNDIQCLCCGTSTPDLLIPGHALMVMGELGLPPVEAVSTAGVCLSSITALKFAYMNVLTGASTNAVATGSELASSFTRANFFQVSADPDTDLEKHPSMAFDADFLRWMLSDGAGAAFLSSAPNSKQLSLRIDWMEHLSYAGELETCMYAGGSKEKNGRVAGWRSENSLDAAIQKNVFAIRQDIRLLDREIVRTSSRALLHTVKKHKISPKDVDWFLPHYSSHFFREKFYGGFVDIGFEIPYEKWFTNLYETGNVGSASFFLILEGLLKSGKLRIGDKLLCYIPESGRFSHCYLMLSVV